MKTITIFLLAGILALATAVKAAEPAVYRPDAARLSHACTGCHGTHGRSQAPTPALANKSEEDFLAIMHDFKSGRRVSSVMNRIARAYTDEDFVAMARFFKQQ